MFKKLGTLVVGIALAISLLTPKAEAQCSNILDPGWTTGGFTFVTAPIHAQTFIPPNSGTVCEIRYGVDQRGGMVAYNVYVALAPGVGPPPTNYTTTNLFSALGQTSFNTLAGGGIDGKVIVTNGLTLTAGVRYVLVIEPIGGQMAWRGTNGNPYPNGQGWWRSGATWVTSTPSDLTFRIIGLVPPPNNNNCNSCQPIGLGTVNGTTVGATTDGASACGGTNDVWYCFTAPCAGTVVASTCTTSFDSIISVHTGCPGTEIACNDDCPGTPCLGPGSCVAWNALCGVTYRIRVASFSGALGTFSLNLSQPVSAPSNNNIANAINVGNVTNAPFSTCGATTDGPAGCPDLNDIWYTYTPNCQGTVRIDLCGSSFDTYLAVYAGPGLPTTANLVPGACNDDNGPLCGGLQSSVQFPANPCTTYYIRVGGYAGLTGCGDMTISCSNAFSANDACAGAVPIGPGLYYGTTSGATPSGGASLIPGPCGASGATRDVWYSYTPPCTGQLTIDTCGLPCIGPRYDTVLSVYTGLCSNPLNQVASACNDDAPCGTGYPWSSRVVTNVTGGINYKIRVSGYAGSFGNYLLNLAFAQPPLVNDNICNAIAVPCGTSAFSTCGATNSPEPTSCPVFNDVWYRFTTPNCAGPVTLSTCSSPLNTVLAVYSGTCGAPAFIACNDDAPVTSPCPFSLQSWLTFPAAANTTYFVRVGAATNVFGNGVLTITCPTAPPTCPPAAGSGLTVLFDVNGFASGAPWAFRITIPCCFDLCVQNVPGVVTTGTQTTDEANLRDAFVNAINAACPAVPPIATAYPYNGITSLTYGKFGIKAKNCGTGMPASLAVGPAFTPCNMLCVVTPSALPTSGPCSFNPDIVELELQGIDCNANGEDDYVDILEGTSADLDGNNVPDECDLIANGPGTAYCAGDGLQAQPTTACPCGNPGGKGHGCASSFNPEGAAITASGVVAADNVVLTGSGMQATGICVFLQGDAIDPNGFVFGDGITCTGGSLVRLRSVALSAGSASFPVPPETITLSQRGSVTVGSGAVRSYTVYYRNAAAAFCPPATFNAANSYHITW